jgi:hypothetical protein
MNFTHLPTTAVVLMTIVIYSLNISDVHGPALPVGRPMNITAKYLYRTEWISFAACQQHCTALWRIACLPVTSTNAKRLIVSLMVS